MKLLFSASFAKLRTTEPRIMELHTNKEKHERNLAEERTSKQKIRTTIATLGTRLFQQLCLRVWSISTEMLASACLQNQTFYFTSRKDYGSNFKLILKGLKYIVKIFPVMSYNLIAWKFRCTYQQICGFSRDDWA